MTATKAWAILLASITIHELTCHPDHLLTAGIDRARAKHPALDAAITIAVAVTAGHLTRTIPPSIDPFRLLAVLR